MRSTIIILAALTPAALATLFITEPIATTICSAETPCNIRWNDNGVAPALADIGPCEVGLWVGSQQTQVELQVISPSTDISKQATITYNPDPNVGPNSGAYFIRFTSLLLKDAAGIPYEGFSAKFTLNGMTGTFNSTIQSLINSGLSATATPPGTTASIPLTTPLTATLSSASSPTLNTVTKPASVTSSGAHPSGSATTGGAVSISAGKAVLLGSAFFASALLGFAL